jgi:dTMP kinase
MTKKKSHFIVLEGLDGTGKSTQVNLLQAYYSSIGLPNHFIHFPRTNHESPVFGEMVARFLRGEYGENESVHPELVALIYAGDRFNAKAELISKLENSINIIADRYVFSNIGFQCAKIQDKAKRKEMMLWILDMEYNYFQIPKPDVSVFLHVPINFVEQQLRDQRSGDERNYLQGRADIHEKNIDFQKKVEEVYLEVCELMPDSLHYLSCMDENGKMMAPQKISEKIIQLLSDKRLL